ncbi:MAG: hypothetical protein COA78_25525 [Blastopirellula sp.]|nr:MAG: hypothetical protein COA78_25525 [Blastopirellula sp.]
MKSSPVATGYLCGVVLLLGANIVRAEKVDFVKSIQPIIETVCLACHSGEEPEGEILFDTFEQVTLDGDYGQPIVPGKPEESSFYTTMILPRGEDGIMPPSGSPLKKSETDLIKQWITEGAAWPKGLKLTAKERIDYGYETPDNMELIKKIHASIVENQKNTTLVDYAAKVPRTNADFEMVAIKGGEFLMGSPANEANREENEGPQVQVKVDPFWIGKLEVSWDEYEPFMITQVDRAKHGARVDYDPVKHTLVDAVSQPTPPYVEMSFGMGQAGYPAISMTQHGANKYCQWLSAQTKQFYRLATEAEWEYACRAGTTTAYSFGDDMSKMGDYAWYYENSNEKYQKVGKKKPNPWGLHDMHGNVMEWTTDQFVPDYFAIIKAAADGKLVANPMIKPDKLYPRSVRGGNWDDDPEQMRSAIRRGSDPVWKQQDPQLPVSIWYHTNAQQVGFRIVRPLKVPSVEEMYFYWNSSTNKR